MSLINQMLRDLDARKAGESARANLPSAVTPLAARVARKHNLLWLVMAAIGLIVLVAWFWRGMPQPVAEPLPPPSASPAATPHSAMPDMPPPVAAKAQSTPKTVTPRYPPAALSASSPTDRPALALRKEDTLHTRSASPAPTVPGLLSSSRNGLPAQQPPVVTESRIEKQPHRPTPTERAESAYRSGLLLQQQGQGDDALNSYRTALAEDAEHAPARQATAALLIEMHRFDEAEDVLSQGVALTPVALPSTLALARLKVERGATPAALDLLLSHAEIGEHSAEYQGFLAALLNRAGRRDEAIDRYQVATRLAPNEARWWAGLGIVLEAEGKNALARDAYMRARELPSLPGDLAKYIEQRLRQ